MHQDSDSCLALLMPVKCQELRQQCAGLCQQSVIMQKVYAKSEQGCASSVPGKMPRVCRVVPAVCQGSREVPRVCRVMPRVCIPTSRSSTSAVYAPSVPHSPMPKSWHALATLNTISSCPSSYIQLSSVFKQLVRCARIMAYCKHTTRV